MACLVSLLLLLHAIGAKHTSAHLSADRWQEAKPYRNDPDVVAMTSLVDAYQRNNINEFEKTLKINRYTLVLFAISARQALVLLRSGTH